MALAAPFPAAGTTRVTVGSPRRTPRSRPAWSGLRLTARGRAVLMLLSALFLLAVVILSGRITAEAGTGPAGPATASVVVQGGESLWQIATRLAPESDPREVVTAIRELNGLGARTLEAGQSLVVPVFSARS